MSDVIDTTNVPAKGEELHRGGTLLERIGANHEFQEIQRKLFGNGNAGDDWLPKFKALPTKTGVDPTDTHIEPGVTPERRMNSTGGGGVPSEDTSPGSPKQQEKRDNNNTEEKRDVKTNKLGSPSDNTQLDLDLKKMQHEIREVAMARMGANTPQEKAAIEKIEADYYKDKADYYKRFTDALNDPSNTYEQARKKAGTEPEPCERLKEYWKQVDEALRERLKRGI